MAPSDATQSVLTSIASIVDRFALGGERRFHDRLGERGMRMDGLADFGRGGFERLAEHDFGNQVSRMMADYLATDDFAVLLARDQLDESLGLVDGDCLAVCAKRHPAYLDIDSARFRFRLIEAHRRDFGLTVNTSRHGRQVEAGLSHPRHNLDCRDTLGRRLVRQQRRTHDVADRVNALAGGAERIVYLDEAAALDLDTGFFQAKVAA